MMTHPHISTSRGGKVIYTTPCCGKPAARILAHGRESYLCECGEWGAWKRRVKTSKKRINQQLTNHPTNKSTNP